MNSIINSAGNNNQAQNIANNQEMSSPNKQNQKLLKLQIIKKELRIRNKTYYYEGPETDETLNLIQQIEENEQNRFQVPIELQGIPNVWNSLENETDKLCTFFNGKINISIYTIVENFVHWVLYLAVLIESLVYIDDERLNDKNVRKQILQYLPLYSFLFTLFNLILFRNKILIVWLFLFIIIFIIPLFVMLDYQLNVFSTYQTGQLDYLAIFACGTSCSIFLNSLFIFWITSWITKMYHKFISLLFSTTWCLLVPYFIGFKVILTVLLTQNFTFDELSNSLSQNLGGPVIIVLIILSILLIQRLFTPQSSTILFDLAHLQFNTNKLQIDPKPFNSCLMFIKRRFNMYLTRLNLDVVAPILFSLLYAVLELYSIISLLKEMQQVQVNDQIVVSHVCTILAIPLFTLFGINISCGRRITNNTMLWMPIVYGALPSLVFINISNITSKNSTYSTLTVLLLNSPLIVSILWLSVTYFKSDKKHLRQSLIVFMCYFFAFPAGILLPLSNTYTDTDLYNGGLILIYIGLIPLIGIVIYYFFVIIYMITRLPKQSRHLDFHHYKHFNYNNYANWLNAIGFMISFYVISYFVWNNPSTITDTESGYLQSLLFIHPALFILVNIALRIQSQEENTIEISRYNYLILFGVVVPFVVLLPIGLTSSNEVIKSTLVSISIGIPISFSLFKFLLYIRNSSQKYQNFVQPVLIILGWICLVIPFGVIMPVLAAYYENTTTEFATFAQLSVAFGLLICIVGVTLTSLFFSILLNKEYIELKKREVLRKLIQYFADNAVSADQGVATILFLRYIQKPNKNDLIKNLINGNPVNVLDYFGPNRLYFEKILVQSRDFEIKQKKDKQTNGVIIQGENEIQNKELVSTCFTQLEIPLKWILNTTIDCCFCRCGLEELTQEELIKQQKEFELNQLEEFEQQSKVSEIKKPDEQFMNSLKHNDFYGSIKIKPDKVEQFWQCLYNYFSSDIGLLMKYIGIERDDDELSQLPSFTNNNNKLHLSVQDFAQLLKSNIVSQFQSPYDQLWATTLRKFPILLYNYPQLVQQLRIPLPKDSVFSKNKFNQNAIIKKQGAMKILKTEQILQQDNFDESVHNRKVEEIESKYRFTLTQSRLKLYTFFRSLNYYIWQLPFKLLSQVFHGVVGSFAMDIKPKLIETQIQKKSKPWEELAQEAGQTLIQACSDFDREMRTKEFKFRPIFGNITALLLRVYDLYGLITLAFSTQVAWFGTQSVDLITTVDGQAVFSSYDFFFFISLSLCCIYAFFGKQAAQLISEGTFGLDENGNIAKYDNKSFWISQIITLISGQFIMVMKTYIDAFVCNYSVYPYTLYRDSTVICMSSTHYVYIILAFIGAAIYYPLSTFLQPSFQFMNHSLDLKYKATYIVLQVQAKLLILGLSSVFSNLKETSYMYQMLFASVVMAALNFSYYKMWPCYVKWFNNIEFTLMMIVLFCYFGAFLILLSGSQYAGWIFTGILTGIAILYLVYFIVVQIRERNVVRSTTIVVPVMKSDESNSIIQEVILK